MKTIQVKFIEPKIKNFKKKVDKFGRATEIILTLDWYSMGIGIHRIYKKDGMFVFTDKQSPIPVRNFQSLSSMMWEYELPKSLEIELKKLV